MGSPEHYKERLNGLKVAAAEGGVHRKGVNVKLILRKDGRPVRKGALAAA
jgi:hypothetical protein